MKAMVFTEYGSLDVLKLKDVDIPTPGDNEVLIKIHSVAINDWELGLLSGKPYFTRIFTGLLKPKQKVQIPGCDIAGCIEAVGKDAKRFKVGDDVYGDLCVCGFGGFAEYVCATENALELKSCAMSFVQAASIPQAAELAIVGLIDIGNLQAGQSLLINGAGGGVGTIGLQIAKSIGAEVTVVDSAIKLDMLREIGADHVIDYQHEDFTKNGKQYDLIIDTKTSRSALDYLRSLNASGMYVTVGGNMFCVFKALLLWRWVLVTSNKKLRLVAKKPTKGLEYMNRMFESGQFVPVIDGPYQFSEIMDALRHFESAEHKGKVMVTMDHK